MGESHVANLINHSTIVIYDSKILLTKKLLILRLLRLTTGLVVKDETRDLKVVGSNCLRVLYGAHPSVLPDYFWKLTRKGQSYEISPCSN